MCAGPSVSVGFKAVAPAAASRRGPVSPAPSLGSGMSFAGATIGYVHSRPWAFDDLYRLATRLRVYFPCLPSQDAHRALCPAILRGLLPHYHNVATFIFDAIRALTHGWALTCVRYLLFRGFTNTLRSFDAERRNDGDRGLRVDKIVDQLFSFIEKYEVEGGCECRPPRFPILPNRQCVHTKPVSRGTKLNCVLHTQRCWSSGTSSIGDSSLASKSPLHHRFGSWRSASSGTM